MVKYTKRAYSHTEHIELLRARGLCVPFEEKACRYLSSIGYYRLKAYFIPYFTSKDVFASRTTFDDILSLYIFDRKLRILTMDAISRIEIAVRTSFSNSMSLTCGPHWFMDEQLFKRKDKHLDFIDKVEKGITAAQKHNHMQFCKHYKDNYADPYLPPSWMICEVLPMGVWSRLYENLEENKYKRKIADNFNFPLNDLAGWLHSLTLIRNCIAHHSRFWNVVFPPRARRVAVHAEHEVKQNTPYTKFVTIAVFLRKFTNDPSWPRRFVELAQECPLDIHHHMKIPKDWQSIPLWQ